MTYLQIVTSVVEVKIYKLYPSLGFSSSSTIGIWDGQYSYSPENYT